MARTLSELGAGSGVLAVGRGVGRPRRRSSRAAGPGPGGRRRHGRGGLAARPPAWTTPAVAAALAALVGPGARPLAAHGAKDLMRALLDRGIDVRTLALDTALAAYLLDPAETRYVLDDLLGPLRRAPPARRRLGRRGSARLRRRRREPGAGDGPSGAGGRRPGRPAARRARRPGPAGAPRRDRGPPGAGAGPHGDRRHRRRRRAAPRPQRADGATSATSLTEQIWADAGEEFNVNSTPQLREVLFDQLGLTPQKKTKTGFSTDAASLEKLAGQHPIIEHLLRYREVEKLRSTYGEGLLAEVGPDGRIHATFNQTVARTGRLSSDAPNLHNIPVRSEVGRTFRAAFVPAPGLRVPGGRLQPDRAALHRPPGRGPGPDRRVRVRHDIHTETAARVFGVEPRRGHRRAAVQGQDGLLRPGLRHGGLRPGPAARRSPRREAQEILDAYFEAFPAVRAYMDRTVAEARERGYTETLFGRRRQIPELSSSNFRIRQAGERQAMNAGIQGLAADIFKVALVRLDHALERGGLGSRLILQVHDEVILEVPPARARRRDGGHARRHVGRVRPAGAARGQPVVRGQLGGGQGLSGGAHAPTAAGTAVRSVVMARNSPEHEVLLGPAGAALRGDVRRRQVRRPPATTAVATPTSTGSGRPPSGCATAPRSERDLRDRGPVTAVTVAAGPLVRAAGRPPGRGLPALLVHQGHRATRWPSSSTCSASTPAPGCSTSGAARAATPCALAERGIEVVGVDISAALRRAGRRGGRRPAGDVTFERLDARELPFDAEFDAVISLCQGAFGLRRAWHDPATPGASPAPVDPDGVVLAGMARALRPGGRLAVSAFSAYFQVRYLEDDRRLRRRARREPRAHRAALRGRAPRPTPTCGRAASRPASCACWPRAAGLEVERPVVGHARRLRPAAPRSRPPRVPDGGPPPA